jgi:predicted RNase H-like HicB family nuclease
MKQVYPAFIVDTNDGSEYPFLVCVPDLKIITEASTFADAIGMGRDAIRVTVKSLKDNNEIIPVPSNQNMAIEKVRKCSEDIDFSKGILTYIDVDFKAISLKERLEAFYGKPIDEIYVELGEELNKDIKKKELTLDDIFKDYNGEMPPKDDFDWGKPVGSEVL